MESPRSHVQIFFLFFWDGIKVEGVSSRLDISKLGNSMEVRLFGSSYLLKLIMFSLVLD
jgi:hypothetical protein